MSAADEKLSHRDNGSVENKCKNLMHHWGIALYFVIDENNHSGFSIRRKLCPYRAICIRGQIFSTDPLPLRGNQHLLIINETRLFLRKDPQSHVTPMYNVQQMKHPY